MAECSGAHAPYLYCDPLVPGQEVEFAALKHRKLGRERDFSNDWRIEL